jgi:hypothetical protein
MYMWNDAYSKHFFTYKKKENGNYYYTTHCKCGKKFSSFQEFRDHRFEEDQRTSDKLELIYYREKFKKLQDSKFKYDPPDFPVVIKTFMTQYEVDPYDGGWRKINGQ